jgi:ATP synthase protein I
MSLLGPEGRKQVKVLGSVGTAGIELAVAMVIGLFGGRWLDGVFGTEPWLQWLGFGFGIAAGFRSLFRTARRVHKQLSTDAEPDDERDR